MGRSNETIKIYPSMKNELRTGCPKSQRAKVWAYCSAFDHLIRKIFFRECSRKVAHSRNSMVLQIANETINCEVLTYDKNRGPVDNVNTHYNKSPIVGDSSKFTPQLM